MEFRVAQIADPDFCMAFWGEAMTYKHALWREEDQAAALAALAKVNRTHLQGATRREQLYIQAADK